MDSWLVALMIKKDSVGLIMLDVELLKACSVTQYNSIKQVVTLIMLLSNGTGKVL